MTGRAEPRALLVLGRDAPVTACFLAQLLAPEGRIGLVAAQTRPGAVREGEAAFRRLETQGCAGILLALTALPRNGAWLAARRWDAVVVASGDAAEDAPVPPCRRVILNADDPDCRALPLPEGAEVLTCSERRDGVTVAAKNLRPLPYQTQFEAVSGREIVRISVPVPEGAGLYPGLLAATAAVGQGLTLRQCARRLRFASPVPRFENADPSAGGFVAAGYIQAEIERIREI